MDWVCNSDGASKECIQNFGEPLEKHPTWITEKKMEGVGWN
jgi:hypothetical protein